MKALFLIPTLLFSLNSFSKDEAKSLNEIHQARLLKKEQNLVKKALKSFLKNNKFGITENDKVEAATLGFQSPRRYQSDYYVMKANGETCEISLNIKADGEDTTRRYHHKKGERVDHLESVKSRHGYVTDIQCLDADGNPTINIENP